MRVLLGLLGLLALIVLVALGPNLIWLARSTARITNDSGRELRDLRLLVGEREVVVGAAGRGETRFVFLPEAGEATLQAAFWTGQRQWVGCQEYVEGSMYHVEIVIGKNLRPRCTTSLPLLNRLFWQEALWGSRVVLERPVS